MNAIQSKTSGRIRKAKQPLSAILESQDVRDKFWSRVKFSDGDSCWEWTGCRNRDYGEFYIKDVSFKASRVSWTMENGEIPAGMFVCHKCDNPPCVRPSHLFIGTSADNIRDAFAKGRRKKAVPRISRGILRGDDNPDTRISDGAIIVIRELFALGVGTKHIADLCGVGERYIRKIVAGERRGSIISRIGALDD